MKISHRNTDIMRYLENGFHGIKIQADDQIDQAERFRKLLDVYLPSFKSRINFLTYTYKDVMLKSAKALLPILSSQEFVESSRRLKGTLIFSGHAICYDITLFPKEAEGGFVLTFFNGVLSSFSYKFPLSSDGEGFQFKTKTLLRPEEHFQEIYSAIYLFEVFKRYAEIETLHVKRHGKGHCNGEKYVNDCGLDINVFDSKWYRDFVNTQEFGVSGHFRLQAFGPGRTERKLIWIKEFVKHGYSRKPKMLQEETTNGSN